MRRFLLYFCVCFGLFSCSKGNLESVNDVCSLMDDNAFVEFCQKQFDVNKDGKVSMSEAAAVTEITLPANGYVSLKGLEYFTSLTKLICHSNRIQDLDVSKNSALTYLDCHSNQIRALDLSQNNALVYLNCHSNRIHELDISSTLYPPDEMEYFDFFLCLKKKDAKLYLTVNDKQYTFLLNNKPDYMVEEEFLVGLYNGWQIIIIKK